MSGFLEFKSYVKKTINFLHRRAAKRALKRRGVTRKVPRVMEAKWNTFVIAATFIDEFRVEINAVIEELRGAGASTGTVGDGDIRDFEDIVAALVPFRGFIEAVEGDHVSLARAFEFMVRLQGQWEAMPFNQAARAFRELLDVRFDAEAAANPGTADGVMMDLAFSLYKRGHAEHLRMVHQIASGNPALIARREVQALIARLAATRSKFVEIAASIYPEKAQELGDEYQKYVATESAWADGQDAPLGWAMKAWQKTFTPEFVHVAQVITELPASSNVSSPC
jgi:hypothetical protein